MHKNLNYAAAGGLGVLTGLGILYGLQSCNISYGADFRASKEASILRRDFDKLMDETDLGDLVGQHNTYMFQASDCGGIVSLGNVTGIPKTGEEPTALSWDTQTKQFVYDSSTLNLWNVVLEMGTGSRHDPAVAVLEKRDVHETTYQVVAVRAESVDQQRGKRFDVRAHPFESQQNGVWSTELFPGIVLNYRSGSTDVSVAERRMDSPRRSSHLIRLPASGFTFDFESLGGVPEQFTVLRQRDGSFSLDYLQDGRTFLTATGTGARDDPAYLVLERNLEHHVGQPPLHDYVAVGLREVRGTESYPHHGPRYYEAVVAVQKPEFDDDQGFQAKLFRPDVVELFFGSLTVIASR